MEEKSKSNNMYFDFDKYKNSPDPEVRERASNWGAAIGLQAVDHLRVSSFLLDLACRNIEGEITMDEVQELIDKHYKEKKAQKNRYLVINPPAEYAEQPRLDTLQVPHKYPTSTPTSNDVLQTSNPLVKKLVSKIGNEQYSIKELMEKLSLKDRKNFLEYHLTPAMEEGIVRMLYPESPRHPRQRYLLTVKGQMTYSEIVKKEGNK